MDCATSRIATVIGAYKAILPFLVIIWGVVMQFCSAIRTENFSGKDTDYPSISRQREGQKIQSFHKNFFLIFNCLLFSDFGQFIFVDFLWSRKRAKQKSLYTDIKESAGTLLLLQNDVLCNGFEIQRRYCYRTQTLANSTKTHRVVGDGIFS